MAYHIYHTNEINDHLLVGSTCKCEPEVKFENGEMIIIHNSFDGREGLEMANEILNPKGTKPENQ